MGAIYMNLGFTPFQRGAQIVRNFFHHLGTKEKNLVVGVYPDASTMGVNVSQNVFYKAGTDASAAVMGNGFSYITTSNNIYVDCPTPFKLGDWLRESWGVANYPHYVSTWKAEFYKTEAAGMLDTFYERYPELRRFWTEDRVAPKTNSFTQSIVYNPTVPRAAGNESKYGFECVACDSMSDVQGSSSVWLAVEDPGFGSVNAMNFSLSASSVVAHIPGWVEINFDAIGLLPGRPIGPTPTPTPGVGTR